jgi:hypothetical protein
MAQITLINAILGSILGLIGFFVTCLNITVLVVLVRCGYLSQRRNGIYILAFGNLIGDTIQQMMVFLYVGPSSVAQVSSFLCRDHQSETKNGRLTSLQLSIGRFCAKILVTVVEPETKPIVPKCTSFASVKIILFQSFLVNGDRHHWVVMGFAYVFLFAWYEGIIIQGLIAVDRWVFCGHLKFK